MDDKILQVAEQIVHRQSAGRVIGRVVDDDTHHGIDLLDRSSSGIGVEEHALDVERLIWRPYFLVFCIRCLPCFDPDLSSACSWRKHHPLASLTGQSRRLQTCNLAVISAAA
ncbi:hypothetical protein ACA040_001646 [Xenophilus aerolatus]